MQAVRLVRKQNISVDEAKSLVHELSLVEVTCKECKEAIAGRRRQFCNKLCKKIYHDRIAVHKYNTDPDRRSHVRNLQLIRTFGITLEQFNQMIEKQNGVCAICEKVPSDEKWFCVDHNHTTNVVRSLLCSPCNLILGLARENPNTLLSAAKYMYRWNTIDDPELASNLRFNKPVTSDTASALVSIRSEVGELANALANSGKEDPWSLAMLKLLLCAANEINALLNNDLNHLLDCRAEEQQIKRKIGLKC